MWWDFFCARDHGVSICPRIYRDSLSIQHSTVIVCDCRGIINLNSNGITQVFSNRGPAGDGNCVTFTEDDPDDPISYVRVFSAHAKVVSDSEKRSYIQIDGRNYLHGQGVDLIISTYRLEHHFILLGDGEEMAL